MEEAKILDYLKIRFDRIEGRLDAVVREQGENRVRITRLDEGFAGVKGEIASLHGDFVSLSVRLDRVNERLDRIENRLDLAEAPRPNF
jgi:hypothetical protein